MKYKVEDVILMRGATNDLLQALGWVGPPAALIEAHLQTYIAAEVTLQELLDMIERRKRYNAKQEAA